jgi:uncharacterized membrane protein YvlD (DUF360 family)
LLHSHKRAGAAQTLYGEVYPEDFIHGGDHPGVVIRPILIFLTLPATLITFGLFLFIINAGIILLDAYFVHGFRINGFWWALVFSILLSVILSFFDGLEKQQEHKSE